MKTTNKNNQLGDLNSAASDKYIGEAIRKYRNKQQISQSTLSKLIGIERIKLSEHERGYYAPTRKQLYQLSEALNVEITDLIPEGYLKEKARQKLVWEAFSVKSKLYDLAEEVENMGMGDNIYEQPWVIWDEVIKKINIHKETWKNKHSNFINETN